MSKSEFSVPGGKTAGALMATCAIFSLVAVSHHPVLKAKPNELVSGMARLSFADGAMHASV